MNTIDLVFVFPSVKGEKEEAMEPSNLGLSHSDQEVVDSFRSEFQASLMKAAEALGFRLTVRAPDEKRSFIVTLVYRGGTTTILNSLRELRTENARVDEAWFNTGGSYVGQHMADGITLLVRTTDNPVDVFPALQDRLLDVAAEAGLTIVKVHFIPLYD